jgi:hypothetical protein
MRDITGVFAQYLIRTGDISAASPRLIGLACLTCIIVSHANRRYFCWYAMYVNKTIATEALHIAAEIFYFYRKTATIAVHFVLIVEV